MRVKIVMRFAELVPDNPLLVKHVRCRLRTAQVVPVAAIVLVFSACIAWAGSYINWIGNASAVLAFLGLQTLILTLAGTSQINTSLGGARESGLLNFHRVTPLPPSVVALGFFLGAPIREYLLAALTVPFALYNAFLIDLASPWRGLSWMLQLELAVLVTIWVVHALAMLGCLTRKKPRGTVQGAVVSFIIIMIFGSYGSVGFYFGAQWLLAENRTVNFFGTMVPWLPWLLIYELPLLGFLGLAAVRKIRAERTHAFTKSQAIACMATATVLLLGGIWNVGRLIPPIALYEPTPCDAIMLAAVYALSFLAMLLTVTITPVAGEYVKGIRRARREGLRRPGPWTDAGSNRLGLFILCLTAFIGASCAVWVVGRPPNVVALAPSFNGSAPGADLAFRDDQAWLASRQSYMSRPIVIGVLTAAYFGLALQYFSLRTPRSGAALTGLFLFVVWLGPLLAAAILGIGGSAAPSLVTTILALSPLPGIVLAAGFDQISGADAVRLAALSPAISFAFLFKYLLIVLQRKVDRMLPMADKPAALPEKAWALDAEAAS